MTDTVQGLRASLDVLKLADSSQMISSQRPSKHRTAQPSERKLLLDVLHMQLVQSRVSLLLLIIKKPNNKVLIGFLKVLTKCWIEILEDKTCKVNSLDLIVLIIMLHIQVQPKKVDQLIKQKVKRCLLRGFNPFLLNRKIMLSNFDFVSRFNS